MAKKSTKKKTASGASGGAKKKTVKKGRRKAGRRKGGPNKSAAIRELIDSDPSLKPAEISARLKEQGIDASPAYVSTIKSTSKSKKAAKGRRGRPKGAVRAAEKVAVADLIEARKLADKLGGIEEAKAVLDALAKLQ